jgi:hypothetical protein
MKQLLTAEQIEHATALWNGGATLDQLCAELRINRDVLIARRAPGDQLSHLGRRRAGQRLRGPRATAPTPEVIAERAAAIRATWSPVERLNRLSGPGSNVDSWGGERQGGRRCSSRINRRTW